MTLFVAVVLALCLPSMLVAEGRSDSLSLRSALEAITEDFMQQSPDSALRMLDRIRAEAERAGQPAIELQCLKGIGKIQHHQGHIWESYQAHRNSYRLATALRDTAEMCWQLIGMAEALHHMGMNDLAIERVQASLTLAEATGDPMALRRVHVILAGEAADRGDAEAALVHAAAYMQTLGPDSPPADRANLLSARGSMYSKLDRQAEAKRDLDSALVLVRSLDRPLTEARVLNFLATTEKKMGLTKEARQHAEQALRIAQLHRMRFQILSSTELLAELYKTSGDASRALAMKDLFLRYKDTVDRANQAERAVQEEYRTRMAEQQRTDSLLAEQEKLALHEAAEARVRTERNRKLTAFGAGAGVLVLALVLWRRLGHTRQEKARSEAILHNVLPEEVARELRETGTAQSRAFEQVTVLFTDFAGFTEQSAALSQQALMAEIEQCFTTFDGIIGRHGIEKIKTIGDAYMAAAGLKGDAQQAAVSTVQAALEMQAFIEARHAERSAQGLPAFRMRVGIHTGPVVAGIVGVKKFQYDIWGDTVNTASRMESSGEVGKVNISEATHELVKEQAGTSTLLGVTRLFDFTPRGKVQAKGKGEMEMYFVRRSSEAA